jgi:transposase
LSHGKTICFAYLQVTLQKTKISEVSEEKLSKIRSELSENPSGWKAKEIMNIIYERTGIRYHEVHIYRLLHKWKFSPKVPRKRFVNTASNEEKKQFKKRLRR